MRKKLENLLKRILVKPIKKKKKKIQQKLQLRIIDFVLIKEDKS